MLGFGSVRRIDPFAILGYAVAILSVAVVVAAGLLLDALLQTNPTVSLFLCAIMFATWFGGVGPGLAAIACAILAFDYFYLAPVHSIVMNASDLPRIILFTATALFVVFVISSLQRTVQRLSRAERELQLTIDTIPTMVASYGPEGFRDFVNQAWQKFTGLSKQEIRGRDWSITVHPDDIAPGERAWRTSLATGEALHMEQRFRRFDGEYRWHIVDRVPLKDDNGKVIRWYSVSADIEDQKRAQDALRRSEAYLAEAQRLSVTGSFGWNIASGDIVWSDETYRILEVDRSVKPTLELVLRVTHPEDRELVGRELARAAQEDYNFDFEHRLLMASGRVKHLHVRSRRAGHAAGDAEMIGALMDVTATREAQEALQSAHAQLARVTRLTTLGEMSASIAHEVNQPLAAVVTDAAACLRWLNRETPDVSEARNAAVRILKAGNQAGDVIRSVRALSSKADSARTPLDINGVIDEVIALVRRELFTHQVSLRIELAPDLPLVSAHRVQLQQVIINLVINGIEAMEPVNERPRLLTIRSQADEDGWVRISVEDCGAGISAEQIGRLFDPFFTTKANGIGMGLSICRSIIEAHGGRVWAVPNPRWGATFHVTLPRADQNRS